MVDGLAGGDAGAHRLLRPSRIAEEVPERSNGAVSNFASGRPELSRSVPESELPCGFQPAYHRVLSRLILPYATPSGANSGANQPGADACLTPCGAGTGMSARKDAHELFFEDLEM